MDRGTHFIEGFFQIPIQMVMDTSRTECKTHMAVHYNRMYNLFLGQITHKVYKLDSTKVKAVTCAFLVDKDSNNILNHKNDTTLQEFYFTVLMDMICQGDPY